MVVVSCVGPPGTSPLSTPRTGRADQRPSSEVGTGLGPAWGRLEASQPGASCGFFSLVLMGGMSSHLEIKVHPQRGSKAESEEEGGAAGVR